MRLYVVRHGQTNYNDLGLCNADPTVDVHLTKAGIEQAQALAQKLKSIPINHIFISELKRTKQTADIVNKNHNCAITIDPKLNDNRTGYEGKRSYDYYAALDSAENKWTVRFNGGESLEDVKSRVQAFLEDLKRTDYDSVLIVTSRVIIQAIYGILEGVSNQEAWEFSVDKASCRKFEL